VTAEKALQADPRVRTVYAPTVSAPNFCLNNGKSFTVDVTYAAVPTSNKLWVENDTPSQLLGYSSANLAATGNPAASTTAKTSVGLDIAFDKDGNLWAFG